MELILIWLALQIPLGYLVGSAIREMNHENPD